MTDAAEQRRALPPASYDNFADIDSWDDARATTWAEALESRAAAPDQAQLRAAILDAAALEPGATVVEFGAGTGPLLAELAHGVGPSGRVIALEPQPVLAKFARARIESLGLAEYVSVIEARGEDATLADGVADVCIAQTVMCHLADATRAATLAQMLRITRAGGRVICADQDAGTWVIDHPDRVLTDRLVRFYVEQHFTDGWMGRRLRSMFAAAGLADIRSRAVVTIETEADSYMYRSAIRRAQGAADAGWLSADEFARWTAQLAALAAAGRFFSSLNFYVASGVVPR
jgi:ubiquinone/menaquinone biosynthesis C-methylase UbiE